MIHSEKVYLTGKEMDQFENLLTYVIGDTFACWEETRILKKSASLSCDGNISILLLETFDKIWKIKQ